MEISMRARAHNGRRRRTGRGRHPAERLALPLELDWQVDRRVLARAVSLVARSHPPGDEAEADDEGERAGKLDRLGRPAGRLARRLGHERPSLAVRQGCCSRREPTIVVDLEEEDDVADCMCRGRSRERGGQRRSLAPTGWSRGRSAG